MLLFTVPAVLTACPNGRSFWLQPQFEACNLGIVKAWCFPTASATLLAYYKDKWASQHVLNYPETYNENSVTCGTTNRTVSWSASPWGDYMYHDSEPHLGTYMRTHATNGTSITNGNAGLKNFLNDHMSTYDGTVSYYERPGSSRDNDFLSAHSTRLPFLAHITPACALSAVTVAGSTDAGVRTFTIAPETINSESSFSDAHGSILGHTVVVWEQAAGSNWVVASNSENERSANRTCTGSIYNFVNDACLTGITAVTFTRATGNAQSASSEKNKADNEDDTDSTVTIIIVVCVAVVVIGLVGGAFYYRSKRDNGGVGGLKAWL